jgi:predicted dehydrogenase
MFAIYGTGAIVPVYVEGLIGAGIAADQIVVVGRREDAARSIAARYGVHATKIGSEGAHRLTTAIVAVTPDALPALTRRALEAGVRKLLVEKPGALSSTALEQLHDAVETTGATAHMVFQRRFLPSVARCRELIDEDGGAVSCFFDLTEVEEHVRALKGNYHWRDENFTRWGLVNPIHVLDLVQWLVGRPAELAPCRDGRLPWHPSGATFSGTGKSANGTALVYLATWGTAGRWRIEVTTPKRRLFLCPVENLEQQLSGSFSVTKVNLPAEPAEMKPGFRGLIKDFLARGGPDSLPDLKAAAELLKKAEQIFGYA